MGLLKWSNFTLLYNISFKILNVLSFSKINGEYNIRYGYHLFMLTLIKPLVCSGISARVLETVHVVGIKIFKNSEVGNYNK